MFKKILKISLFSLILALFLFSKTTWSATNQKKGEAYPQLANYFLKWTIEDHEVAELAKWDLLVLDMEVQENSRAKLKKIRELNPQIIILAYITSQEANADIYKSPWANNASLRKKLINSISDNWWLRDSRGERISFWPGTYMLNLSADCPLDSRGQAWNDFLPDFVNREIISTGLWDGVMYDNIWGDVSWVNSNISLKSNRQTNSINEIDTSWSRGTQKMLSKTRGLLTNRYLILGNGRIHQPYQDFLNGALLENFPASWEGGGDWGNILENYSRLKNNNKEPQATIINSYDSNRQNYQKLRFGLTSTLLENHGYFSFDFDVSDHSQLWWYDEYDVNLGQAQSPAYNLLDPQDTSYKKGLWRRDYSRGIVLLNSTDREQLYVFQQEEFEKINGSQDRGVNNGTIINFIRLKANDGVILLKRAANLNQIKNNAFNNGDYVRVFNQEGRQTRAGFFSYLNSYPANSQIIVADIDNDGQEETLVNFNGIISIYKNGRKIREFQPYEGKFRGEISMAIADLNGDRTMEIITGAGAGGGPHVRVFDINGRPLIGGFFAYDQNFRGGVRVAVMDLDGDGHKEIITAAGKGGGPHIRVFDKDGRPLIGGFFAYEQNFRGGVSLAIADLDGDGEKEIITAPGLGTRAEVKIFNKDGHFLKSFLASDSDFKYELRVMADDLDGDGRDEILLGSIAF